MNAKSETITTLGPVTQSVNGKVTEYSRLFASIGGYSRFRLLQLLHLG